MAEAKNLLRKATPTEETEKDQCKTTKYKKMKTQKISFENFKNEKLSGKEQKMIQGGDDTPNGGNSINTLEESDTNRGNGKGSM